MNANVKALSNVADQSSSLASERAKVVGELESIDKKLERLREAETAQRELLAELDTIGRLDEDDIRVWVAGNCESARPQPRDKERSKLTTKLASAAAAAKAARVAGTDLEAGAAQLRTELAEIDSRLSQAALDGLLGRYAKLVDEWEKTRAAAALDFAILRALSVAVSEIGQHEFSAGNVVRAQRLYATAEQMRNRRIDEPLPTEAEAETAMRLARIEIHAALTGTAPSSAWIDAAKAGLHTAAPPSPTPLSRDQMMAAAMAANQATNVVNRPDPS